MVLYVFVVAYVGRLGRAAAARGERAGGRVRAGLRGGDLRGDHDRGGGLLARRRSTPAGRTWTPASARPREIGELLLTKFLLPFEAASFLLLVAAVGAVVLARKRRGLEEAECG